MRCRASCGIWLELPEVTKMTAFGTTLGTSTMVDPLTTPDMAAQPTDKRPADASGQGGLRRGAPMVLHTRVVCGTGGGVDKTVLNSPRFLRDLGYDCKCAFMRTPGDAGFQELVKRAELWQAPIIEIDDRGFWDWNVARDLLAACRANNVAIWHAHDYKSNLLGLWVRRHWPMKMVTTVHGWVSRSWKTPLYYGLERLSLRHYDQVICVSEDLREVCLGCGVDPGRLRVIDNAIDTEQFRRRQPVAEAKARWNIPPERVVIGAVGRLAPEKAFDVLIHAVDRLIARGLDVQLMIAGEGPLDGSLQSLIRELGREDRIQLVGFQADTVAFYHAIDIYALSSLREGLPNVILEAMALEVPVVASRIAGLPKIVAHGENGVLIDAASGPQLEGELERLTRDAAERNRLGLAGRRTIEERFSFSRRMQRITEVYREVLPGAVPDSAPGSGRR
jgi:glycosyltransferase involved in cell wall biosynthesis